MAAGRARRCAGRRPRPCRSSASARSTCPVHTRATAANTAYSGSTVAMLVSAMAAALSSTGCSPRWASGGTGRCRGSAGRSGRPSCPAAAPGRRPGGRVRATPSTRPAISAAKADSASRRGRLDRVGGPLLADLLAGVPVEQFRALGQHGHRLPDLAVEQVDAAERVDHLGPQRGSQMARSRATSRSAWPPRPDRPSGRSRRRRATGRPPLDLLGQRGRPGQRDPGGRVSAAAPGVAGGGLQRVRRLLVPPGRGVREVPGSPVGVLRPVHHPGHRPGAARRSASEVSPNTANGSAGAGTARGCRRPASGRPSPPDRTRRPARPELGRRAQQVPQVGGRLGGGHQQHGPGRSPSAGIRSANSSSAVGRPAAAPASSRRRTAARR